MTTPNHSQLPFKVSDGIPSFDDNDGDNIYVIISQSKMTSCVCSDKADAEFIVRACNNHYKLLESLKELVRMADPKTNMSDIPLIESLSLSCNVIVEAEKGDQ